MHLKNWFLGVLLALGCLIPLSACAQTDSQVDLAAGEALEEGLAANPNDTFYALGLALAQNLAAFDLSEQELEHVKTGLIDGVMGKEPRIDIQEFRPKIQELALERRQVAADKEKAAGAAFADQAAAEEGASRTDSGLVYKELVAGTGDSPNANDRVKVHYHGTLRDGSVFDSSVERDSPAEFGLKQVIKCWTEGVQLIKVGGKSRLTCPSDIAYGDRGRPPSIPAGATLAFEVELLEIIRPEAETE